MGKKKQVANILRAKDPKRVFVDLVNDWSYQNRSAQAAKVMLTRIKVYARLVKCGLKQVGSRMALLNSIKQSADAMKKMQGVNQDLLGPIAKQIETEASFLKVINDFRNQKDPHVDRLLAAMQEGIKLRDSGLGTGPDRWKGVETIKGGKRYTSVRGHYIAEKLSPYNKTKNEQFGFLFCTQFTTWRKAPQNSARLQGLDTWEQLVDYHLHTHDETAPKKVVQKSYHSEEQRFFDRLEFDARVIQSEAITGGHKRNVSEVYAWYAQTRNQKNQCVLSRYDRVKHANLQPMMEYFHTRGSTSHVSYPDNGKKRTSSAEKPELWWGKLYVFIEGEIYVASADEFHSYAAGGKDVASAGAIAAHAGKIVSVDNVSGHYNPDWRKLRQVVQFLANKGAFSQDAVVGLFYSTRRKMRKNEIGVSKGDIVDVNDCAFLPWLDFLQFCHTIGNKQRATQKWKELTRKYGKQPPVFSGKCADVFTAYSHGWNKWRNTWKRVGEELVGFLHPGK